MMITSDHEIEVIAANEVVAEVAGEEDEEAATTLAEGPDRLREDEALLTAEVPNDEKSTPIFHAAVADDGLMAEAGRAPDLSPTPDHDLLHDEDVNLPHQGHPPPPDRALRLEDEESLARGRAELRLLVNRTLSLQVNQKHPHDQLEIIEEEEEVARQVRLVAEARHAADNTEDNLTLSLRHAPGQDQGTKGAALAADDDHYPQRRRSEASPLISFGPERGVMTDG
jgi:hypothetical protein